MDFYSLMDKLKGQAPGTEKAVRDLNRNLPKPQGGTTSPKPTSSKGIPGGKVLGAATRLYGGATAISPDPNLSASDRLIGGFQATAPLFGSAVAAGAGIADWMKTNLAVSDFTSGRGSGAKALVGKKQRTADLKAQAESLKPLFPNASYTEENLQETPTTPTPPDPDSGGVDTRTGTKYDSFQEQQTALMNSIADRYSDPRTAALIRGIPQNPFSSTQLPYTSDNYFTNSQDFDLGIDTSGMLERINDIDPKKIAEGVKAAPQTFPLEGGNFIEDYESPVNFNAPKNPVDPMLNPAIDGMHAMRMKDRDLGLMYASGQFFAEGSDGSPVLVNRDLAKSVRRGDEGAKDQLAAYLAGGGIKPQGGVISNPKMEQMVPTKTESPAAGTESLVDPSFNSDDYEVMGGDPANSAVMQQGGGVQMDIDSNFDFNSPKTTQFSALDHPFSKVLAENPENRPEKMQVVDTDKFGSVTSLINKYGIDDYLNRMNAGQFF